MNLRLLVRNLGYWLHLCMSNRHVLLVHGLRWWSLASWHFMRKACSDSCIHGAASIHRLLIRHHVADILPMVMMVSISTMKWTLEVASIVDVPILHVVMVVHLMGHSSSTHFHTFTHSVPTLATVVVIERV